LKFPLQTLECLSHFPELSGQDKKNFTSRYSFRQTCLPDPICSKVWWLGKGKAVGRQVSGGQEALGSGQVVARHLADVGVNRIALLKVKI
jgi:hypothetical protein